jgi:hypothetical protein
MWVDLAPGLTVARQTDFSTVTSPPGVAGPHCELGARGYGTLPDIIPSSALEPLRVAVTALVQAGLPPVFAHVYDELWEPLALLSRVASEELGAFDVLHDAWIFNVSPGKHGWKPHRGCHRFEGGRTMLNVWIALTPATRTRSCMYVVPLDRDPAYPSNLEAITIPKGQELPLEVPPGTACVWDANVLHWGGDIAEDAPEPRMSITYTLRKSSARRAEYPVLDLTRLDLRARLDMIASQLLKYRHMEEAPAHLMEWAKLTSLACHFASR